MLLFFSIFCPFFPHLRLILLSATWLFFSFSFYIALLCPLCGCGG
jgi:hypothetical protein